MNHRASTQEQQRLEERVRDEVERASSVRADAERGDHEAELRDRREREHALDVVLRDADRRGKKRGERADERDDRHHGSADFGGDDEERERARDQVDARGDHRRGVNQRADRCGTFHRVGQPDVQWELCGLANRAAEDQQRDDRDPRHARERLHLGKMMQRLFGEDVGEIQIARLDIEKDQTHKENRVADARREERFKRSEFRADGLRIVNVMLVRQAHRPKADEQVRAQPHDFPEQEQLEQVRGDHQAQHAAREERDVGEKARIARVVARVLVPVRVGMRVLHVADAVDENHQAGCRHHKERDRRERINQHARFENCLTSRQRQKARQHLNERLFREFTAMPNGFEQHAVGDNGCERNACYRRQRAQPIVAIEKENDQREGEQGENGNQECEIEHRVLVGRQVKVCK